MKRALVTGGTSGIGEAIANDLRANGLEVITCARNDRADILCDVTDRSQVEAMREKIGSIDILVNNVGGVHTAPFLKIDEQEWDWHIAVNLKSVYLCTHAFLPSMLQNKWGRIINIGSTAGKMGGRFISAYVAAKHAVVGFTKALAIECAQQGVTVNAVCPSFVDTPLLRDGAQRASVRTGKSVEQILDQIRDMNPQKRFVTPQEVAHAVRFIIDNGSINGQAISICGGETF